MLKDGGVGVDDQKVRPGGGERKEGRVGRRKKQQKRRMRWQVTEE